MAEDGSVRIDLWLWSVRLIKTRSQATAACKAGHVRVNDERAKAATAVRAGDEIRLRHEGRERIVVVRKVIRKRVGAPVAAECLTDKSPPPPPREALMPIARRERGAGRPTKRDRRELDRLRALNGDALAASAREARRTRPQ
ncbi:MULTISPECIES: RNA-binding S4 domain-containing protein [Actinomadura]|uniref:RNA-binding S4 domain-containing protein n=1 Tax=Actinomadura TaxID=1988 RepID=UPI00047D7458|nr:MULTISPECIES: RNA-binding S4 domain-containing protein [Actinomadura]RSN43794.1 RNA-binding S4 domain-containing protein [Actinomadura sp. WAC 06369]